MSDPEWLTAKVDQLIAKYRYSHGPEYAAETDAGLVMMMLTEPPDWASEEEVERWERTCDNCGTYCPPETEFYTGTTTREVDGRKILITIGICANCMEKPDGQDQG